MMPVMVFGMNVVGKHCGAADSLIAGDTDGGDTELLMTGLISRSVCSSNMFGWVRLSVFLTMRAFTSSCLGNCFKECVSSKYIPMRYLNSESCIMSSSISVASGRITHKTGFAASHLSFACDSRASSVAASSGQRLSYSQVQVIGALAFTATINVR